MQEPTIKDFLGEKVEYDKHGQYIWAVSKEKGHQKIADLRGWGAIQNLFKEPMGAVDFKKAEIFQDNLGQFIVDAISEKVNGNKALIRKIEIHIETTQECLENFNLDTETIEAIKMEVKFLKEIKEELSK